MANPLILLHGALGSTKQMAPLKELLQDEYEIFDLNFSGHGGNPFNSDGFGIDVFAQELSVFMDEHGIRQADIFGYSMGGFVALKLALKEPEKIGKIITLGTKFAWTPETAQQEIKQLNPDKIMEKVPKFGAFLEKVHAPIDWKELMNQTSRMMIGLGEEHVMDTMDFENIEHEIVIGIGTEDNMVTMEESKSIADRLPNGTLKVFEGFKHPMEQIDLSVLADVIRKQSQPVG